MSDHRTDRSVVGPVVPGGPGDMWMALVRAIAYVRVLSADEVLQEVAAGGGDLLIDSKDAVVVIPIAEEDFGGNRLVDVSDLGRRDLTSLRNLSELMWQRWTERHHGGHQ